ncbi:hypothetical protein CFB81_24945 [Burkholderia sp. AU28863]|nr:hypothetical protein CFB81_24945 [Burkholderia sp. AU28863]
MASSADAPCRSRDPRAQTLCDQRLGTRMLRISTCLPTKIVDKPARCVVRRDTRRRAVFEAARTKPFGSSAWSRYAQAIHTLANKNCGQAGQPAWQAARHAPRRHATGYWAAARRFRSSADKAFRIKRLVTVCAGYPHACQHNLWVSAAWQVRPACGGYGVHRTRIGAASLAS